MNEEKFWESALGRWIRNCITGKNAIVDEKEWRPQHHLHSRIRFSEICNGQILNLIFGLVEPECVNRPLLQKTRALDLKPDLSHKIRLFHHLLSSIINFYREHCLYPISLPDVLRIAEEPVPEKSGHEIQKIFGLLLGALVHSDQHSELLDRLKCTSEEEEQIVAELAKVTGNNDFLINLKPNSNNHGILNDPKKVRRILESLVEERNHYALRMLKMAEDLESDTATNTSSSSDFNHHHHENGCLPSDSSKQDQINKLKEENEILRSKLQLRINETKLANNAAEEYEKELNEFKQKFIEQQKQLSEAKTQNVEFQNELRSKIDEIKQLHFNCEQFKNSEHARKALLNEKEKWNVTREENDKLKKELETLGKSISSLRVESTAGSEFRRMNEDLNSEIRKLRTTLNNSQTEYAEATEKVKKLADENEELRRHLDQMTNSFASKSNLFQDSFNADLSLGDQLNNSMISELEHKIHELQLELARAAQPEELQSLQKNYTELQDRFNDLDKEKSMIEDKLKEQNVELKKATDQLKQAERSKVELKSKLVELSVLKAQVQQQEIIQREKDFLSNKLKNVEETLSIQKEQLVKETTKCRQLESELQKQKQQLNKDTNVLEELEDQLQKLRLEHDGCARLRKSLESECASLRQRIEFLEDELAQTRLNATNSEVVRKRLAIAEQSLLEKQTALNELDADNQNLKQQAKIATDKMRTLREEFLTEKTRLSDLLSRLRSICTTCRLKSADTDQKVNDEELLKDDNLMINTIDTLLLSAFSAAKSEADSLRMERQVQLEEINVLRRNIEDLKETHSQFDTNGGNVDQDKMRTKMGVLQERLNAALARENELAAEVQASKRAIEDLQRQLQQQMKSTGELTRMRINQRDVEQELHSLKESLTQTTEQLHLSNKERHDLNNKLIRQQNTQQAQQTEIDRLTKLNQSIAVDFDRSRFENNDLKNKLRQLKDVNQSATSRQVEYKNIEESMVKARDALKAERERLANSEQNLSRVTRELNETRRDYASLLRQKDTTSEELAQLCETNSAQKSAIHNLNLTIQQLNNALSDKENELGNFRKEIETLREYNSDENKLLIKQIEMLMRQNQDLHKRSDNFYAEQKDLQEKLLTIRRHKEKLEEKVAEQYKQHVESMRKPEKTTLVKRAARALHLRSPSRKASTRLHEKASGSEDSSIYSAEDEGFLPSPPQPILDLPRSDNLLIAKPVNGCRLTPACSSSDRGSGSSPDYDQIHFGVHHSKKNSIDSQQSSNYSSIGATAQFRARNTRIGGSLRCAPSFKPNNGNWKIPTSIEEDLLSLNGSERSIDVTSGIRPYNGLRNGGSIRSSNRLPPPYIPKQQNANTRPPPPSYSNATSRVCLTPPVKHSDFAPLDASTPKSNHSSSAVNTTPLKIVPKEGEPRPIQLDPVERQAKAQSFYDNHIDENLNNETLKKPSTNNNDLWIGYGCV